MLSAIAVLLALAASVVKMSIIGFYPHDLPVLVIVAGVGAVLLWIGQKLSGS